MKPILLYLKRILQSLWRALNSRGPVLTPRQWFQTGAANLVLLLHVERPAIAEMFIGTWEILYGGWLLMPWDTFSTSPITYHWMRSLLPQAAWGILLLTTGVIQIACLAWPDPKARHYAARVSLGLWAGMCSGWFASASMLVRQHHNPILFHATFGLFCGFFSLIAVWISYRLAPEPAVKTVKYPAFLSADGVSHAITTVETTPK